ncbi:hypothetical protein K501DRAFT_284331 [Backusella circina FSU 941]|nr:hypothetical protein K501DRAFT_284331 [Backusella circina FSU 941]
MLNKLEKPHLEINSNLLSVNSGPPSPALSSTSFISSVSWMAEKTSNELIPLLKNAYGALKDKERDLVLAAELGKSLLEHNIHLKNSYDNLLKNNTPPITPSSSCQPIEDSSDSGIDSTDEDTSMRFIPSKGTREAMIEVLERKNTELANKLEVATTEKMKNERSHTKNTRELETEINYLKSNLEIATSKIQELQDMNEKQRKIEAQPLIDNQNETIVEELYSKIDSIEQEKEILNQSKSELESKLAVTLKDLQDLKSQFEKFEFTQKDFSELNEAYQRQFLHIDQLNTSLNDHQNILQKLKEKGVNVYSTRSTPTPSVVDSGDDNDQKFRNTLMEELESEWLKSNSIKSPMSTRSLSDGFQSLKDLTLFTEKSLAAFYHAPSVGLESVLSKATGIDQSVLDDALSFINRIEKEHNEEKRLALYNNPYFPHEDDEKLKAEEEDEQEDLIPEDNYLAFGIFNSDELPVSDIYPDYRVTSNNMELQKATSSKSTTTFAGRLRNHVRRLFRHIWRWCRFAIVLTTALLINAWQGPDALLISY